MRTADAFDPLASCTAPKSVSGAVVVGRFCTKAGAAGATLDGAKASV